MEPFTRTVNSENNPYIIGTIITPPTPPDISKIPTEHIVIKTEPEYDLDTAASKQSVLFQCDICNLKFDEISLYKKHERIHENQPVTTNGVSCPHCDVIVSSKSYLAVHIQRRHTSERPHKCYICGKGFVTKSDRARHEDAHNSKKFSCGFCASAFKEESAMEKHEASHASYDHFTCVFCQHVTHDFESALQHKKAQHSQENIITCYTCNASFTELLFKDHIKTHHKLTNVVQTKITEKRVPLNIAAEKVKEQSATASNINNSDVASPILNICDVFAPGSEPTNDDARSESVYKTAETETSNGTRQMYEMTKEQNINSEESNTFDESFGDSDSLIISEKTQHNGPSSSHNNIKTGLFVFIQNSSEYEKTENFTCVLCGEMLSNDKECRRHQRTHKPPFNCKTCSKQYKQMHSFLKHSKLCIRGENKVKNAICSFCNKQFRDSYARKFHEAIHMKRIRFQCRYCSRSFLNKVRYLEHENLHTKEKIYNCKYCDQHFFATQQLRHHELTEHLKVPVKKFQFKCSICDKGFMLCDALEKHMAIHFSQPVLQCYLCNESFDTDNYFLAHFRRDHRGQRPYKCKYCTELFNKKASKAAHELSHTESEVDVVRCQNIQTFPCTQCSKSFTSRKGQKLHELCHGTLEHYKCRFCERSFRSAGTRAGHERTHTKTNIKVERFFPCRYCGKRFPRSQARTYHERIHTNEKPYECRYCGKTFRVKSSQMIHERTHTGVRPYPCRYCDKRFSQCSVRISHERIHTNEKPYKCRFCHKTFRLKIPCVYHERIHTGERPYPCRYCDMLFRQGSSRRRHERIHTKKTHLSGFKLQ